MDGRVGLAVLLAGIATCTQPGVAAASDWRRVTYAKREQSATEYIVQVDKASIRRTGDLAAYWLRIIDGNTGAVRKDGQISSTPADGPSLYEDNCTSGRFRIVQGDIIWGYDGPSIPINRPAEWQYIEPDSLAELVHKFVCGK